jgi:hypothetical protein
MTEEAAKRLGFNAKGLDMDGVVRRDNLSLEESTRHLRETVLEDKVTTGDPKGE